MIKTFVKANSEREARDIEKKLVQTGYKKIADCMWAKIYTKNSDEVIVTREY